MVVALRQRVRVLEGERDSLKGLAESIQQEKEGLVQTYERQLEANTIQTDTRLNELAMERDELIQELERL